MTNAFSLFRSLVIYGVCLPLAIFIGYLLATPTDIGTLGWVGFVLGLMTIPLFLRWHYPWLILSWNTVAGLYFLPGNPTLSFLMIFMSFGFSILAYIMNRNLKFISVPSVSRPLLFIGAVVAVTGYLTSGFGFSAFGSEAVGGKRYLILLSAIIGYYALTAHHIPARKVRLYVGMYFLGALTFAIGNLVAFVGPNLYFIFLLFPAETALLAQSSGLDTAGSAIVRLGGLSAACVAFVSFLLAMYGLEGMLDVRKWWRLLLLIGLLVGSLFGGFRSMAIQLALTMALLFLLEGMMRSRALPIMVLSGILLVSFAIPFADKLPLSVQRSLTFLPLNLDRDAQLSSEASTAWRIEMWKNVLPTVPQYLILGKGLGIDASALEMSGRMNRGADAAAGSELAGDYHSGPLSTIIPFGIAGVIGLLWFMIASIRLLYRNYQFGDPENVHVNRFLFVSFVIKCFMFFTVFGSFYGDLVFFVGPVGLSIAINGGLRSPAIAPVVKPNLNRFRLANAAR